MQRHSTDAREIGKALSRRGDPGKIGFPNEQGLLCVE